MSASSSSSCSDSDSCSSSDSSYDHYESETPVCCVCQDSIRTSNYRLPSWDVAAEEEHELRSNECAEVSISPPLGRKGGQTIWELCYLDKVWTSDSEPEDCTIYGYVRGYKHKGSTYCTDCYSKTIIQGNDKEI